jgi:FkbM family methyltransferase
LRSYIIHILKSNKLALLIFSIAETLKNRFHEKYIVFKIFIFKYFKTHKHALKGLYIDCGSNLGQGYDFFSKYFPNTKFDHILIEPNPFCITELKNKYFKEGIETQGLRIIGKAADIKDGTTLFYGVNKYKGKYSDGASIKEFHNSALYDLDKKDALEVETFDFSKFINDCSKIYELIIVKMDIEGSEYDILNKLLSDGNANYIDLIFIEFHSSYMVKQQKDKFRKNEKNIITSFRKLGIEFYIWR